MIDFGNMLCKVGLHKEAWITYRFGRWRECLRCGKEFSWERKKWFRLRK